MKPLLGTKRRSRKINRLLCFAGVIIIGILVLILLKGPSESFRFIFQSGLRSTDNKTNVLLLGNAGGIHDGAQLTDTIMVASIDHKTNKTYLISIPRDLWVDLVKSKINAIYEIGENKDKGGGLLLSKQSLGGILGIPIHYAVRVDFSGFVKAVDLLGGIDVLVEKTFQDSLYPVEGRENDLCGLEEKDMDFNEEEAKKLNIPVGKRVVLIDKEGKVATDSAEPDQGYKYFSCRYETISFKAGQTHMDGAVALKFVRSRMGTNGENSDFARSKRQQLVLESFRKKAFSVETFSTPSKIPSLLTTFGQSFETDIPASDFSRFYSLSKKIKTESIVLATDSNSLLVHPPQGDYGGAWVLVPKSGNYNEIHEFILKTLKGEHEASSSARPSNK